MVTWKGEDGRRAAAGQGIDDGVSAPIIVEVEACAGSACCLHKPAGHVDYRAGQSQRIVGCVGQRSASDVNRLNLAAFIEAERIKDIRNHSCSAAD